MASAALFMPLPAAGQSQESPSQLVPAVRTSDRNGVDLMIGSINMSVPLVSFGASATRLQASLEINQPFMPPADNPDFMTLASVTLSRSLTPRAGERYASFTNVIFPTGSGYYYFYPGAEISNPDGSRYKRSLGASHFTRIVSTNPNVAGVYNAAGDRAVGGTSASDPLVQDVFSHFDKIIFADGEEWTFHRQFVTLQPGVIVTRTRFVVSSRGYAIQYLYVSDVPPTSAAGGWFAPRRVTAYNKAFVACNEALLQECPSVTVLPTSTDIIYDANAWTITIRPHGEQHGTELTMVRDWNSTIGWPGDIIAMRNTGIAGSTRNIHYGHFPFEGSNGMRAVYRVSDAAGWTNYSTNRQEYDGDFYGWNTAAYATSTNSLGGYEVMSGYIIFNQPYQMIDELNRTIQVDLDFNVYRPIRFNLPGGIGIETQRDVRNNVTRVVRHPRPNEGLQPFVAYQATFPADCMNPRTCNRPTSTTDGNNNVTNFEYAPEHGGILTRTGPAVPTRQINGTLADVRPQTRYEYAQRTPWVLNGSGSMQAGPPVWVRTKERYCRTTAAAGAGCAGGAADEVVTEFDYGPNSGPNNLVVRGISVTADVNGVPHSQHTCFAYDHAGNRISETGPNAGVWPCP